MKINKDNPVVFVIRKIDQRYTLNREYFKKAVRVDLLELYLKNGWEIVGVWPERISDEEYERRKSNRLELERDKSEDSKMRMARRKDLVRKMKELLSHEGLIAIGLDKKTAYSIARKSFPSYRPF
jgi:hypothetical protein